MNENEDGIFTRAYRAIVNFFTGNPQERTLVIDPQIQEYQMPPIPLIQLTPLDHVEIDYIPNTQQLIQQMWRNDMDLLQRHNNIRFFGPDHVVPSAARNLLINHGDPYEQALQDDVLGRIGGQGRFCNRNDILPYNNGPSFTPNSNNQT